MVRESAKTIPSATPPIIARPSDSSVSLTVNQALDSSEGPSVHSVSRMRLGAGIR